MKNNTVKALSFYWLFTVAVFNCSDAPTHVNGGASDIELSAKSIIGSVVDSTGKPATNTLIRLRPKNFLLHDSQYNKSNSLRTLIDTLTDEKGCYRIDSLDTGSYIIELNQADTLGSIVEFNIDLHTDSLMKLSKDTLLPLAIISGDVEVVSEDTLVEDSIPHIHIYGLERHVHPDKSGKFNVKVPKGRHRFRLSSQEKDVDELEVVIEIEEGEYKDIGRLKMHRKPTSKPPCYDYSCDSIMVRRILDQAGHDTLRVKSVSTINSDGRIAELYLRGLGLTEPTKELGRLLTLEVLDLGNNNYSSKLAFTKKLTNLRVLYLDSNNITEIGGHVKEFYYLEELNISNNQLINLQESITNLSPYIHLDLSFNRLCAIDSSKVTDWADTFDPDWREKQNCP